LACPDQDLHLVMDKFAKHKHKTVQDWLAASLRLHCHLTPIHASWS
jgi:hypothetical protein